MEVTSTRAGRIWRGTAAHPASGRGAATVSRELAEESPCLRWAGLELVLRWRPDAGRDHRLIILAGIRQTRIPSRHR